MKIIIVGLLLWLGGFLYASGFDQSTINEYLYGPYFNDPNVVISHDAEIDALIPNKICDEKQVNSIHNEFFLPGIWEKVSTRKEVDHVITCAWNGNKKAAELMEKMVYASQLKEEISTDNQQLRAIIYHPAFIYKVAKKHHKILRVIPDSHPHYLTLALGIVRGQPTAFNDVTLRYKRHPKMTALLFDSQDTYDDIYKHMAIQYTMSYEQQKSYIMHNGLLYLELPIEIRKNPYLAYHAYVQNDIIYPYIPKQVVDVFNADGAIMVPRYMTKLILVRQKLANTIKEWGLPITEALKKKDEDPEIVVNVDDAEATENIKVDEIDEITFEDVEFKNERTVVTDIRVINKIEMKKKRRLLNLWRIARFGDDGQVYIAMFRPDGKNNLGAIVVKQKERIMFSDYAAVFSMDGESIWRIKDGGTFSAKTFLLDRVVKSSEGYLNFSFSWKGEYTTNKFNLVDQSGLLIKEFINYYFE